MKTVRFKNLYHLNKKKIIAAVVISACLMLIISTNIATSISKSTIDYALKQVKKENTLMFREAISNGSGDDIDLDNLINVVKNSKDEIVEVDFDIDSCTKMLSSVTNYFNDSIGPYNFNGYRLDIPLGFLTGSPILVNIGPKIPIKIEISDVALGNVRTTVKEFGINNALVEVSLMFYLRTNVLFPLYETEQDFTFESLIASKIITGTIPDLFNGSLNSTSSNVSLPLGE